MSHKKALILALLGIIGALAVSVASFAATSSSATLSISASSGLAGEFGFVVSQGTPATQMFVSDGDGTTTVSVSDSAAYAVGDHILIDSDADGDASSGTASFHTVTANDESGEVLTLSPAHSGSFDTSASVS